MSIDLQTLAAEREAQIARLRALYRFSDTEAQDFLESLPADKPVDGDGDSFHAERAA